MTDTVKETTTAPEVTPMYGWVCPTCKRVYSPFTTMCPYCGGNHGRDFVAVATTSEYVTHVTSNITQIPDTY